MLLSDIVRLMITIHAPLAGRDISEQKINYLPIFYYNSRTPCGVRPCGNDSWERPHRYYNPRTLAECDFVPPYI